jgi:hypothetical protein
MDFESVNKIVAGLYDRLHAVHVDYAHVWKDGVLFGWRWWLALAIIILPWVLWVIVRKKDSTQRLLHGGFFVIIISSLLDMIGIALHLWSYPTTVFPLMPSYIPFDFSSLPVITMLFIQFFPKIKPVIKALVYAVVGSLVFQPLMELIGLYCHDQWEDYYSIPILFVIYLLADYLAARTTFEKIQ